MWWSAMEQPIEEDNSGYPHLLAGGKGHNVWHIFKDSTSPPYPPFVPRGPCKPFGPCWMFPYCCWLWRGPIRIQASESQKCSSATGLYNNNSRNSHMGVVTMLFTKYMALFFFRAVGKGGWGDTFQKGGGKTMFLLTHFLTNI
jgi:hypothetical protein